MLVEEISFDFDTSPINISILSFDFYFSISLQKNNPNLKIYNKNLIYRDWILKLKKLNYQTPFLRELLLDSFHFLLVKYLDYQHKVYDLNNKIALAAIPPSKVDKKSSIQILIEAICHENDFFYDFSSLIKKVKNTSSSGRKYAPNVLESLDIEQEKLKELKQIKYDQLFILDDVSTTGSSFLAAAKLLKDNGIFNSVKFLALAKTLTKGDLKKNEEDKKNNFFDLSLIKSKEFKSLGSNQKKEINLFFETTSDRFSYKMLKTQMRHGQGNAYLKWNLQDDAKLVSLFYEGLSFEKLGNIFSRSTGSIQSRLQKNGINVFNEKLFNIKKKYQIYEDGINP